MAARPFLAGDAGKRGERFVVSEKPRFGDNDLFNQLLEFVL
jgi:hypothetical protein